MAESFSIDDVCADMPDMSLSVGQINQRTYKELRSRLGLENFVPAEAEECKDVPGAPNSFQGGDEEKDHSSKEPILNGRKNW